MGRASVIKVEFVTDLPPIIKLSKREHKGKAKWRKVAEKLHDRKGEWALIGRYSITVAYHMRQGRYQGLLPIDYTGNPKQYMTEHFEVITRNTVDSKTDIYMRAI